MDFIDLNSACPKDSFPLPRIDQLNGRAQAPNVHGRALKVQSYPDVGRGSRENSIHHQ